MSINTFLKCLEKNILIEKRYQTEILELKSIIINKAGNLLKRFNGIFKLEEIISKLEDTTIAIIQFEEQKEERRKMNTD